MLVLLAAAGAFVRWRVHVALDHRLDQALASLATDPHAAARHLPPREAIASLRDQARDAQLLAADGTVLASGPGITGGRALLTSAEARRASEARLETGRSNLLSTTHGKHLRI